jgi:hypothetical protein
MAGFDYNANLSAVKQALVDYNTTTSSPDLSADLATRVRDENIKIGDPDVEMIRADRMPAIFVRVDGSAEEFASIGGTGPTGNRKEKTVKYSVFAMYGRAGGSERHAAAMTSVADLARNIEAVFQKEFQLSSTALWCNPKTTSITNVPIDANGATWIKTVLVELEAKYFFR